MRNRTLVEKLNTLLEPERFHDYAPNGLQVEGKGEISHVVTGVTASLALLEAAADLHADAVLVHHGWFWKRDTPCITGIRYKRIQTALSAGLNLIAYHLPLDAHPELGNNAQIAKRLGIIPEGQWGEMDLGWTGTLSAGSLTAKEFAGLCEKTFRRTPLLVGPEDKVVRRICWCSGAAQGFFEEAVDQGADLYLSGEISEPTVHIAEETGVPCMLLENCCYGQMEMMVMHMVKEGLFGEVVHCSGGYCHDLRSEVARGEENRHYRLRNYLSRNCENYPTHELGPIAQVLGINRGNRMLSLVSMSTKAAGLNDYAARHPEINPALATAHFNQGDVVSTLIRCAGGQTISLTLDTTLPRGFTVHGTRALYTEDNNSLYLDSDFTEADHFNWTPNWNNATKYLEKYQHPVWRDYLENGIRGGHGGMDGLVYDAFIEAVRKGEPCPIDVYDAAAWMCITPLSEQSIAMGSAPVPVPDFTSGAWSTRR